jgi:AsmA protein
MEKAKGKKRALLLIGGIVAALALAVLALVLLVDIDGKRPRLESEASKALGLTVRIRGEMKIEYFPPFGLSLSDLHIARAGKDVLRVEKMRVGLKILPLFWGQVRFRSLGLDRPDFSIQRTATGPFDFERYVSRPLRNAGEALSSPIGRIDEISITGGRASYRGMDSAIRADVAGLDLTIRDLTFQKPLGEDPFRNVSFTGSGKAERLAVVGAEVTGLSFGFVAKNGNYEMNPSTLQAFGGTGEGNLWVSLTEPTPLIQVLYSLAGSRFERLFAASGRKQGLLEGNMDLTANLFMKGENPDELIGTMSGDISWKGNDLAVPDFDPDALLSAGGEGIESPVARSGALLLPGPSFAEAARGLSGPEKTGERTGEKGMVKMLVSDWIVKNGVFEAKDVALVTKEHRIALSGKIDLPGRQFDNVTIALVDDKGCARAGHTIRGTFRLPRIEEATAVKEKPLPGEMPAGKSKEPVPGEECETFYAGSVPPPE